MTKYLASLTTAVAINFAVMAIFNIINNNFYLSFILGLTAFIVDNFDGYIARITKTTSQFGRQFDSISDMLIYIVYPLLVFITVFQLQTAPSLIVLCLFVIAGAFRLARLNTIGMIESKYGSAYSGVPVVFSYLIIFCWFFIAKKFHLSATVIYGLLITILLFTLSMVTLIPIPKIKTYTSLVIIIIFLITWIIYGSNL